VCRRWRALCSEDALWRPLCTHGFPAAVARVGLPASSFQAWYADRARCTARWLKAQPCSVLTLAGHAGTVFGVCRSPLQHGVVLSAGEDCVLRQWDCNTGAASSTHLSPTLGGVFNVFAWNHAESDPQNALVAVAGFSGDVVLAPLLGVSQVLDLSQAVVCAGHAVPVVSVRGRGNMMASCSFDGTVRLWRTDTALEASHVRQRSSNGACDTVSPEQLPLFTSSAAVLVDPPGPVAAAASPHERSVSCICFPSGAGEPHTLVRGGNDGLIKCWDIEKGVISQTLWGHTGWVWCLEHAGDAGGHCYISGATDGAVRLWDVREHGRGARNGGAVATCGSADSGPVAGLSLCPPGGHRAGHTCFVTGAFDGGVRIYDMRMLGSDSDRCMALLGQPLRLHADRVTRVVATDAFAVSASFDSTLRVWRFDTVF
jgi:WD40 repeat protein